MNNDQKVATSAARADLLRSAKAAGQFVLVFQGGGALGAYQAGVYQALHEAGLEPDWVIGTSIGAINASIIAGNEPAHRLERLRAFWSRVEHLPALEMATAWNPFLSSALPNWTTVTTGIAGFFSSQSARLSGAAGEAGTRCRRILLDPAIEKDVGRPRRFCPYRHARSAPDGWRSQCGNRADAIFRQRERAARRTSCAGLGRAAASFSSGQNRR